MSKYNMLVVSIVLMGIFYCTAMTSVNEQSSDNKKNDSMTINNKHEDVKHSNKQ
jgi:hypothetical protein